MLKSLARWPEQRGNPRSDLTIERIACESDVGRDECVRASGGMQKNNLGDFERLLAKLWQEGINWHPDVVVALAGRHR